MATSAPTHALAEAIAAFVKDHGADPRYKELVGKLKGVEKDVVGPPTATAPSDQRDTPKDDYSFETAQKRHTERLAAKNADPDASADGPSDTDGPGEGK